ncbi:hypothetical protein [Laspinema olomoucense]|uniref:Uncharacterized protein n=1 Tax=Laspinema olomoucense D3b TaxID=2953688 RepID=A0ABT2NFI2_9CYAN|nr:hypothetical protein [Laspinema sp. D3b]MCT7981462.1 hypothetical protein [Laspinema sp. D3b]
MTNQQHQITCHFEGFEFESAPTPQTEIPNAYLLPMGIPPKLLSALQIDNEPDKRYIVLTYQATNCYVEDIYSGHTDSYRIYSAFIDHFAVAIHLIGCDLGSDDSYPVYSLLLDQQKNQIWLGQYIHSKRFLIRWQEYTYPEPILTPEQREQIQTNLQNFYQEVVQNDDQYPQLSAQEFGELVQDWMRFEQEAIYAITEYLDQYLLNALKLAEERLQEVEKSENAQIMMYLSSLIYRLKQRQN